MKSIAWAVFVACGVCAGVVLLTSTIRWAPAAATSCLIIEKTARTQIMWIGKVPLTVVSAGERCLDGGLPK